MSQSLTGSPLHMFYLNTSPPTTFNEQQWTEWLSSRFIPALIESKAVVRASVYREVGFAMIPNPTHQLRYVILCQTDFRKLQDSAKYKEVCERTGAVQYLEGEEAFELRNYRLIQDYNPNNLANKPAPNMLGVEMNPEDQMDFEDWYRNELLPKLSTLKGYIRSKRYQLSGINIGPANPYLALHEIQDLSKAFVSQKAHEEASTPRMERHIQASEKGKTSKGGGFVRRGWQLVYSEGYETDCIQYDKPATGCTSTKQSALVYFWDWLSRLLTEIPVTGCKQDDNDKFEPLFV